MRRANYMTAVSHRCQRGVGLIEVLIALLVLSFGMLGMAGLQMWSLRYNQSAMERGMAVVQTHSIVDAMRANRDAAQNGQFNIEFGEVAEEGDSFALVALRAWQASLEDSLGDDATGQIACNAITFRCTVSVRWNDSRANGAAAPEEGGEDERMQVITTVVQL